LRLTIAARLRIGPAPPRPHSACGVKRASCQAVASA
jgi:hypothetical protein